MKFIIALLFVTCIVQDISAKETPSKSKTKATISTGKYLFKSGIMTMEGDTKGSKTKTVIYFEDYGNKEMTETTGEMTGIKINSRVIIAGGFTYNLDLEKNTGTKQSSSIAGPSSGIDFSKITKKMMVDLGLQKSGTDTILGRICEKWTMDMPRMKMKGNYSVWKNIPLKSEVEVNGLTVTMRIVSIEENVKIPATSFVPPASMEIQER